MLHPALASSCVYFSDSLKVFFYQADIRVGPCIVSHANHICHRDLQAELKKWIGAFIPPSPLPTPRHSWETAEHRHSPEPVRRSALEADVAVPFHS